jgi:hypothetical protein
MNRVHRDEAGQSLVIVLSLITILFLLGSSLAVHASVALRATRTTAGQGNDFYAADAATELGIWWQRNGKPGNPPAQTINGITTSTTITSAGGGSGSCPAEPKPIWMSGIESGYFPMSSAEWFAGTGGTATGGFSQTPDTSVVRTGNYSMKVVSSGASSYFTARQTQGAGGIAFGQTNVFHWATYITSLPAADLAVVGITGNGNRTVFIYYKQSTGKFVIAGNGNAGTWASRTDVEGTVSAVAGQWHTFDVKYQAYTNPLVADWYVDGVAQPQLSWATTGTTNEMVAQFGQPPVSTAATFTAYYDDIMISATPGDFPLGDVRISPAKPNAMGTHNTPANFQNNDSSAINATSWNRVDDIPMPPTANTDYIKQVTAGGATYIELGFEDTTQTCLRGASLFFAVHTTATQANNMAVNSVANGFNYTLWSGSIASTTIKYVQKMASQNSLNPGTGPWTQAVINGLTARFGMSTDVSPVPFLDAILMEYAWLPVVSGPATITIVGTGGGSTVSTSYSDAGAGVPSLTTWTTTK